MERLERTGLVGRDQEGRKARFFAFEAMATPRPLDPEEAVEIA